MPDLTRDFASPFIKAGVDVKDGDHIKFIDVGERQVDKKNIGQYNWIFSVSVLRDEKVVVERKKFQINRTNFKAVVKMYGTNSDDWKDKEMLVRIVARQNPQTGEVVDSIALANPGARGEVEEEVDFAE